MNRLLESNAKVNPIPHPDVKIIIHKAPYISYPQIKLDENFKVYFDSTLRAKQILRASIKMMQYQQSFEIIVDTQCVKINFLWTIRQFAFLKVFLVYTKSNQHKNFYDSYNNEVAAKDFGPIN